MRNIEIFKAISALVFARLYATFPLPTHLVASGFALGLDEKLWDPSQVQDDRNPNVYHYKREHSPAAIAAPTLRWLRSAGLIDYKEERDGKFIDVVLTAKGLESIEGNAGRAERLIKSAEGVLVDATKDAAKKELTAVFSEVLKWSVANGPTLLQVIGKAAS